LYLIVCLSRDGFYLNARAIEIYGRFLTEIVREETRQFRAKYTKCTALRRTQQKQRQAVETIFVFVICDFVLSKHCLPNMKPLH